MKHPDEQEVFKSFGKRLKYLRKRHKLSQSALGGKCNLEKSLIQRLERGSNVTLKTLVQIANGFETDLVTLMDFSNTEETETTEDVKEKQPELQTN